MPSITVGITTIFTSMTDPDVLREIADGMVDRKLRDAEAAYRGGNRAGLLDAAELLQAHRQGCPWPKWVCDGMAQSLLGERHPQPIPKPRGRHAQARTRRRDDAVDCIRATLIDCYLIRKGMRAGSLGAADPDPQHVRGAARAVSEQLSGDAGGTDVVMAIAYRRFHRRVTADPARYYPLLEWRGHQVFDALNTSWCARYAQLVQADLEK